MASEDPKSFLCLPTGFSTPGNIAVMNDILKCMKGSLMRLRHSPMVVWVHKLPLPKDICVYQSTLLPQGLCLGHICLTEGTVNQNELQSSGVLVLKKIIWCLQVGLSANQKGQGLYWPEQ